MQNIGIFDLKTHLSEVISQVEAGEDFLITNRGKEVAFLTRRKKNNEQLQNMIGKGNVKMTTDEIMALTRDENTTR